MAPWSPETLRSLSSRRRPMGPLKATSYHFPCGEFAPLPVDLLSQLPSLHIGVRQEMQSAMAQRISEDDQATELLSRSPLWGGRMTVERQQERHTDRQCRSVYTSSPISLSHCRHMALDFKLQLSAKLAVPWGLNSLQCYIEYLFD